MRIRLVVATCLLSSCADPDLGEDGGSSDGSGSGSSTAVADDDGVDDGVDDGDGDDTVGDGCDAPAIDCGGTCVDPSDDPDHCGGCDQPCGPDAVCAGGDCVVMCGADSLQCGDDCVDVSQSAEHCGECDHACADGVPCVAGECTPDCAEDELQCGQTCASITNDEANCGACGLECGEGEPCVYSRCVDATVHHVLLGGQSLSVGSGSVPVLSTSQPLQNLRFVTGVRAGSVGLNAFVPLIETQQSGLGETIASGMANLATTLATGSGLPEQRILVSAHGLGGTPYSGLAQGTGPYMTGMAQVTGGVATARASAETHLVRAVAIIHGESDHIGGNALYDQNLLQWQADYEADVQAITGQLDPVPMLLCQMSSFTQYGQASSAIPGLQLAAARQRPDRIFVVGPKYFLPYVDGVHLSALGERWLGEYYAKVYQRVLVDGEPWLPVSPREVTREGAAITIALHVPAPPLVLDDTLVSNPGNFGFSFTDDSGAPPAIMSVEIVDDVGVRVTLVAEPTGANQRIRYAWVGTAGQPAGPMTGARGNLRDSDATASLHGYTLYNWAVHFDEPVE